jgi:hypothetical protein
MVMYECFVVGLFLLFSVFSVVHSVQLWSMVYVKKTEREIESIVACRKPLLGYGAVTMLVHATEEHVASAVTSCNNMTAAGSGVATRSGPRRRVSLQWNA